MFGSAGDDVLEVGGALGFGIGAAAGNRQQHLQVVVLLRQRAVQIEDLVPRQQFAPQAFERRLHQPVHERERALLALAALAEADRHHHERRRIRCGIVGLSQNR